MKNNSDNKDSPHDEEAPPQQEASPPNEGVNAKNETNHINKNKKTNPSPPVPLTKILSLATPELPALTLAFFLMIVAESTGLVTPLIIARAYDALVDPDQSQSDRWSSINHAMILVLIIHFTGMILGYVRTSIMSIASERVVSRLRLRVYGNILKQEMAFFDAVGSGELISRLSSDTTLIQSATSSALPEVLLGVSKIVVIVVLMFTISFKLTLATVVMMTGVFVLCIPIGLILGRLSKKYQDTLAQAAAYSAEALGSIRTVQSFASEEVEWRRYADKIGDPDSFPYWYPQRHKQKFSRSTYGIGFLMAMWESGFYTTVFELGFGALYGSLWYGFKLVNDGELSLGKLTAFESYIFQIGIGLGMTSQFVTELIVAKGASGRVFQLLERTPSIPDPNWWSNKNKNTEVSNSTNITTQTTKTTTITTTPSINITTPLQPSTFSGTITFTNVTFSYPSRPDVPVLQNFNLQIPPNTTTALVGSSGSGKSTVVSLLQRFYDVSSGSILLDGMDIRDLDLKWMRKHMGHVQQEPQMFGLSVRDNLTYGVTDREIGDDEIEAVCKEANAHDFIAKFPDQYQTLVGERGVQISGGQKQRIAIARALLVDPRILLLDEATSALDAESEHLVQSAIDRAVVGRTVLVVAHRLSTIRDADQIVVMDERRIVDVGSHEVLVGRCERYRELIRRQFGSKETRGEGAASKGVMLMEN